MYMNLSSITDDQFRVIKKKVESYVRQQEFQKHEFFDVGDCVDFILERCFDFTAIKFNTGVFGRELIGTHGTDFEKLIHRLIEKRFKDFIRVKKHRTLHTAVCLDADTTDDEGSVMDSIVIEKGLYDVDFYSVEYQALYEAVQTLTIKQRTVVFLHFWKGMSLTAIGTQMGISKQTISDHLASALVNLRSKLDREDWGY